MPSYPAIGDWPSLCPQSQAATRLFGADGPARLSPWYEMQIARIDDPAFARRFRDHIGLNGIAEQDYNHRLLRTGYGMLLGGIRFFGGDVSHPFVDVVAHSFTAMPRLQDAVRSEWAVFAPRSARLTVAAGTVPADAAVVDVSIHAAPYAGMAKPDGRVRLEPFAGPEDAVALVRERYRYLSDADPELSRHISPAGDDEIRACRSAGGLYAIVPATQPAAVPAGLIAVRPGAVDWLSGDEVVEEVVASGHAGNGFAASAQRALAALRADAEPDRLLVGMIDGLNHPSWRSAERAGRPEVLRKVFLPLRQRRRDGNGQDVT